jgi:hypothetical protein
MAFEYIDYSDVEAWAPEQNPELAPLFRPATGLFSVPDSILDYAIATPESVVEQTVDVPLELPTVPVNEPAEEILDFQPFAPKDYSTTPFERRETKKHNTQIRLGLVAIMSDLVRFDTMGRARLPSGRMMKKLQYEEIIERQHEIREALRGVIVTPVRNQSTSNEAPVVAVPIEEATTQAPEAPTTLPTIIPAQHPANVIQSGIRRLVADEAAPRRALKAASVAAVMTVAEMPLENQTWGVPPTEPRFMRSRERISRMSAYVKRAGSTTVHYAERAIGEEDHEDHGLNIVDGGTEHDPTQYVGRHRYVVVASALAVVAMIGGGAQAATSGPHAEHRPSHSATK